MTDTLQHDIARHVVAIEKSVAWIADRETAYGVGTDPAASGYPANLVRARARVAELETNLSRLRWRYVLAVTNDRRVDDLLATLDLVTAGDVAAAVRNHTWAPEHYTEGGRDRHREQLSPAAGRRILGAIGIPEPGDRSAAAMRDPRRATISQTSSGLGIFMNGPDAAWAMIHGFEDEFLKRGRDGFAAPTRKLIEAQAKAAAPLAQPKRTRFGNEASGTCDLVVAPNEDGTWSSASAAHLGIHGYDDPALDVGPTYATEDAAWEAAIRRLHGWLHGLKRTRGNTLDYAKGWIDSLARERGIDLRVENDLFGAVA